MQPPELSLTDVLLDKTKDLRNVYDISQSHDLNDTPSDTVKQLADCDFYTESEVSSLLINKKITDTSHLKLLSLNIANVLSKLSSLKQLVNGISNESNKPNIISLTETHLSKSKNQGYTDSEICNLLPGYKFFHVDRRNRKGGGSRSFPTTRSS